MVANVVKYDNSRKDEMQAELGDQKVRHDILDEIVTDEEAATNRFIESHVPKDAYEYKLTQSENVVEWVDAPDKISKIQANLRHVWQELCRDTSPWSIMDCGCYAGYFFNYLKQQGGLSAFSYFGVDIRADAVNAARRLHVKESKCQFETQDIFTLQANYQEQHFDYVFSARVLVHLPCFREAVLNLMHCAKNKVFLIMPVSKVGRCQYRQKVDLITGDIMPYTFRYVSPTMIYHAAKGAKGSATILNTGGTYATIVFVRDINLET